MRSKLMTFSLGALVMSCTVYDSELLSDASGGGGDLSGGTNGSTGGQGASGGDMVGGGGGGPVGSGGAVLDPGSGGTIENSGGTSSADGGSAMGMGGSVKGSGGSASDGGTSGGSGGDPPTEVESIFDDFNDGNSTIRIADGRSGIWYAYNDGTVENSNMAPGPGQAWFTETIGKGDEALHVTATGFTSWGVGLVTAFDDGGGGGTAKPYDLLARGYDAVRFWAKKENTSDTTRLTLVIGDVNSTAVSGGGQCPDATCSYDHAKAGVDLTTSWNEYTIPLGDFARSSSADPIDFTKVLHFSLAQGGASIEFWIDDIRFVDQNP